MTNTTTHPDPDHFPTQHSASLASRLAGAEGISVDEAERRLAKDPTLAQRPEPCAQIGNVIYKGTEQTPEGLSGAGSGHKGR